MKQLSGNLNVLWMALWLVLPQTHYASAQEVEGSSPVESKPVPWASALVNVQESAGAAMTGVVVKATTDSALVLTTFRQLTNTDQYFNPNGQEMMVSLKAKDGKLHEIQGTVTSVFASFQSASGVYWHTTFVEVKHNGLKFTAVPMAEYVPGENASLTVVGRHSPDSIPSASLQNAKLVSEIDPATSHSLGGMLSGTSYMQESLLTVHDQKGALVGIGSMPSFGGMGGGGFGGGGGLFSVADPFNNGSTEIKPKPISFLSIVDRAEELRRIGVPVSDAAITLQKQRRRINKDAFGRPIQGKNLQITWSDDHQELHGFSNARGEWAKLTIKEQDNIIPIVGESVGAVILDGKIAGYSPTVGQWDVLTLSPGSRSVPNLSDDIATVRDGNDYYTFATASGTWTSPTNPDYQKHSMDIEESESTIKIIGADLRSEMQKTNNLADVEYSPRKSGVARVRISGIRHHVMAVERMLKDLKNELSATNSSPALNASGNPSLGITGLNSPLPGMNRSSPGPDNDQTEPGMIGRTVGRLESQSLDLAKRLRGQKNPSADEKSQLIKLVTESLDQKLQQQRTAAKRLREKLESVEKALQSREANRQRIIERRVEELLDPNIDWASLQPVSPSAKAAGLPITGPPHVPVGSAAEGF